jgi:hypothetical protein
MVTSGRSAAIPWRAIRQMPPAQGIRNSDPVAHAALSASLSPSPPSSLPLPTTPNPGFIHARRVTEGIGQACQQCARDSAISAVVGDTENEGEVPTWWRPTATASAKLGAGARYHTACLTGGVSFCAHHPAHSVTIEHSPSRAGVVRTMADSFHGRCVSRPKCARASHQVTSGPQRSTNPSGSGRVPLSGPSTARLGVRTLLGDRAPEPGTWVAGAFPSDST